MVNFFIIYINYVLGTAIEVLKCKLIYNTNKFVFFFLISNDTGCMFNAYCAQTGWVMTFLENNIINLQW